MRHFERTFCSQNSYSQPIDPNCDSLKNNSIDFQWDFLPCEVGFFFVFSLYFSFESFDLLSLLTLCHTNAVYKFQMGAILASVFSVFMPINCGENILISREKKIVLFTLIKDEEENIENKNKQFNWSEVSCSLG